MCIERERVKVDFKSREVNCLKECALAFTRQNTLLYMCIERERVKVDFKSREVNCLKECALAFTRQNTLSFVILVLIIMFTLVSGVHVCNKVI